MQPETIGFNEQQPATRFITLQMEDSPAQEVMAKLQAIEGAVKVTNPQKSECIVEYNPDLHPSMDQQLMQCISINHWQYRQLSHGKTLEEKLFFSN